MIRFICLLLISLCLIQVDAQAAKKEKPVIEISQAQFDRLLTDAKAGSIKAAVELGEAYEVKKNFSEAEKWYRFAFFKDDPMGALHLYDMNKNGYVVIQNAEKLKNIGLKLLKKSADKGDGGSALDLGHFYLFGKYLDGDYTLAHHYFMVAHRVGKPMASYRLGMSYLEGLYHNINANKAMYYLQTASDAGIGRASRQIAIAHHLGIGKPKNIDRAIEYYTKAASEGEGLAMRDLANIYNHEFNDPNLHEKWLLEAVKFDVSDAHYYHY